MTSVNSSEPFRTGVIFRRCPICEMMSELVDCVKHIYVCPVHGQWDSAEIKQEGGVK